MDKRFQVFVSSTYADLKEETKQVIQTLMEMDCIPAGMELFPSADEELTMRDKATIVSSNRYVNRTNDTTVRERISQTYSSFKIHITIII